MSVAPSNRLIPSAITWLVYALVAMPLLQALPIDFDRSGVLVLLLPTLWAGRKELALACAELLARRWFAALSTIVAISVVVSVACADIPAPATVTAASWVVLAAAALIAGRIARNDLAARQQLLAGIALSTAVGTIAMWAWWLAQGGGGMPLYAHHRHLGLHALSGAIASLALVLVPQNRNQRVGWSIVGVVGWAGLLWSGGRGPVLALVAAIALWIAVRPAAERGRLARTAVLLLVGGLAVSAAFWTTRPELGWWHAFERTAAATRAGNVSELTSTRSEGWRESLHRAVAQPWAGHGPDAYRFLTPKLDGQQAHNVVLQLWLDLGLVGGSAAVILLGAVVVLGWRHLRAAPADLPAAAWFALFCALAIEGLLDGVFYHLLAFLPAMLAGGIVLLAAAPTTSARLRWSVGPHLATFVAVGVLALHTLLFHALAVAEPPATPASAMPKLLRAFPSTTFGLWRWTDAWQSTAPDAALAWDRWAETHASNAPLFHLRAAQLLLNRGDRTGAIDELRAAEAKAHWTVKPSIVRMRQDIEAAPK